MTELAHSKLKYGLFSRVISCHDRSAQYCQTAYSKCAPCTVHGHKHLDNDMSLSLQKSDSVTCSMHRGAIMLKHKKIVSGQPLHVWQQEICHYAIFTLTPNVSNVTVIDPVSGKTLEHPCSTR